MYAKKTVSAIGIVACLLVIAASSVQASGYIPIGTGCLWCHSLRPLVVSNRPHWDYSATSGKCKQCHAVHQATGNYRLLRADSATDACACCHYGSAPFSHLATVYRQAGGDPTVADNGHTIGASFTSIPDGPSVSMTLYCQSCHSVHGAKTIGFGDGPIRILKEDPLSVGTPVPDTTTAFDAAGTTVVAFCRKCHSDNAGSASHPLSAADGDSSWVAAIYCKSCHNADGYPHGATQTGTKLLSGRDSGTSIATTALDDNCRRCHVNAGSTGGVSLTF